MNLSRYNIKDTLIKLNSFILSEQKKLQGVINEMDALKLTVLIEIAKKFSGLTESNASPDEFQKAIKGILNAIDNSKVVLDSEDQDDLLMEIESLMDIVDLESSGGYLNEWRYGFDPENPSIVNATDEQRVQMLDKFNIEIDKWGDKLEDNGQIKVANLFRNLKQK